ncbi:MAG: hypothetical protein KAT71_00280 [Gammaproteobacteria bacterium]|nr:hypothetical protein [Gammaproteobacteria bacterium]
MYDFNIVLSPVDYLCFIKFKNLLCESYLSKQVLQDNLELMDEKQDLRIKCLLWLIYQSVERYDICQLCLELPDTIWQPLITDENILNIQFSNFNILMEEHFLTVANRNDDMDLFVLTSKKKCFC